MGKITINHYLNKSVKPKIEGNKELYPLYVQIIANRTNYRLKSSFPFNNGYLRESDLMQDFVINCNNIESKKIEKTVNYLLESNRQDLLTAENIKKYSNDLWGVLNRNFGKIFEKESKVLKFNFPDVLIDKNYVEIDEVLKFTESEIETKFSNDYHYCKIGMNAISPDRLLSRGKEGLEVSKLTVFDFLFGEGYNAVLQSVKDYHGFCGGDEEKEYLRVLEEIKKIILLE